MNLNALIIGSDGQDGQLLTDYLSAPNIKITGVNKYGLLNKDGFSCPFDMNSIEALKLFLSKHPQQHIYYLAAHHKSSHGQTKQEGTEFSACFGVHVNNIRNILEAVLIASPNTRVFYASSSLIFGDPETSLLDENSLKNPICAYGITKKMGMDIVKWYREHHGLFACSGILFNHESWLRSPKFLSRTIIQTAVKIKQGLEDKLIVGNFDAQTDWGFAPDFVKAFDLMLMADKPDDYIIASGISHTVKDWIEYTFDYLDLDYKKYVFEDNTLILRNKPLMIGNTQKIYDNLQWSTTTSFNEFTRRLGI
jgi:GDPmannose 4,6-dehydratase